jgi:DNA primase
LNVKLALKPDYPYLLNQRGLDAKTIAHFGIGYCGQGILRGCVAIPIHDDRGILVAYAGRRTKPSDAEAFGKYKFPKGFRKELVLFNYHNAVAHALNKGLILVEGFFSVFKLHQLGFPNVVASMGCELSDFQTELLSKAKEVILLFDGDDAGRTGTKKAKDRLKDRTLVRLAHLPDGCQPDDLPQRTLRWLIGGLQILDLASITYEPRTAMPTSTSHGSSVISDSTNNTEAGHGREE